MSCRFTFCTSRCCSRTGLLFLLSLTVDYMDNRCPSLFFLNAELSYCSLEGKSIEALRKAEKIPSFYVYSLYEDKIYLFLGHYHYRFFVKYLFLSYEDCSVSCSYTAVLWLAVSGSVSIWDFLSGSPSSKGKISLESLLNPLPSAIKTNNLSGSVTSIIILESTSCCMIHSFLLLTKLDFISLCTSLAASPCTVLLF